MDLNTQPPAIWSLKGPYEIADFALEKKANVLILINAWIDSGVEPEEAKDWSTLNYWAARLRPLWARTEEPEDEGDSSGSDSDSEPHERPVASDSTLGHETTVVICNRAGKENGTILSCSFVSSPMR